MIYKGFQRQISVAAVIFILFLLLFGCSDAASMRITSLPKTEYIVGEALDLSGGVLTVDYGDGTFDVQMSDAAVSYTGFDPYGVGNQTVAVAYSYRGKLLTASFEVVVQKAKVAESKIIVTVLPAHQYIVGQRFDKSELEVKVCFDDDSERILQEEEFRLSADLLTESGGNVITVTYKKLTTAFLIQVLPRVATELKIVSMPDTTEYTVGDKFLPEGLQLTYLMNDGSFEPVALTKIIVSKTSADAEYLRFGAAEIVLADGEGADALTVNVPIRVAKRVSDIMQSDISELYESANQKLQNAETYEALYLDVTLNAAQNVTINGSPLSGGTLTAHMLARQFSVKKSSIAGKTLSLHLYYLLSFGTASVVIETEEEVITVRLSSAENAVAAETETEFVFPEYSGAPDTYAAMFSEDREDVYLSQLIGDGDRYFVKKPEGKLSCFWVHCGLALPFSAAAKINCPN